MSKTFRIWKSTGEPEDIKASKVQFERTPDGLDVKLFTGLRKTVRHTGVVALIEVMQKK